MTIQMTQAMSPNGVHASQVITMSSEDTQGEEIEIIQKWTQSGNTIYLEVGMMMGDNSEMTDEEVAMYEMMGLGTQEYKMQSALTHTEAMAIMSETTGNDDDMDPLAFLEMMRYIETFGTFTPMDDEDGFTMYNVVLDMESMDGPPTAEQALSMCDANDDGSISWDEFTSDADDRTFCGDASEHGDLDEFQAYFTDADENGDSGLTVDELDAFIADVEAYYESMDEDDGHDHDDHSDHDGHDHDSDGPMMVCYDMNTHEVDMSIESESDCEAAGLMWTEMRDDDHSGDHDDGTLYISIGEAMLPFEGDMSDYTIELATCESDYNMETGEETKECTAQMTVSMTDAMLAGSSVMFHDADLSGTISDGDMIHVSETVDVEWSEVRLYSSSADAYSDENPVFEMPGFTGVIGVLALLGAALLRRKA